MKTFTFALIALLLAAAAGKTIKERLVEYRDGLFVGSEVCFCGEKDSFVRRTDQRNGSSQALIVAPEKTHVL
jgi:hypothetical protein